MRLAGGIVWAAVAAWAATGRSPLWRIEVLFLLAPLVLVPLALNLIGPRPGGFARFAAAVAAVGSFAVPPGPMAGLLASPWVLGTLHIAWTEADRLRRGAFPRTSEAAIGAATLFLPVGAGWLLLSRLGARPLGFEEPIVLLTAVHFHFAAFLTLTLVGLAGRVAGEGWLYRTIVAGTVAGTPLLAAGITFSPAVELMGALTLAASLWVFSIFTLTQVCAKVPHRGARALLVLSATSLLPSMLLAVLYAWGRTGGVATVSLSSLVAIHGTLNALGFVSCGLAGWTLAGRNSGTPSLYQRDEEGP